MRNKCFILAIVLTFSLLKLCSVFQSGRVRSNFYQYQDKNTVGTIPKTLKVVVMASLLGGRGCGYISVIYVSVSEFTTGKLRHITEILLNTTITGRKTPYKQTNQYVPLNWI